MSDEIHAEIHPLGRRHVIAAMTGAGALAMSSTAAAKDAGPSKPAVKFYSHTPRFKGFMSDVVAIPLGNGLTILEMGGVAAEDPNGVAPPKSNSLFPGDFEKQARWALNRIDEIIRLHGGTIRNVVKFTVYLTDPRYLMDTFVPVLIEVFGAGPLPGSTAIIVSGLAQRELMIEIDVTAVV